MINQITLIIRINYRQKCVNYFQDLIIDAIYADIIHGKLDQKNKQVCPQTQ